MRMIGEQSILITIVGIFFLVIRFLGRKKISLPFRTVLWTVVLAVCVIPTSLFTTPYGILSSDQKLQISGELLNQSQADKVDELVNKNQVEYAGELLSERYVNHGNDDNMESLSNPDGSADTNTINKTEADLLFVIYLSGLVIMGVLLAFLYGKSRRMLRNNIVEMGQNVENSPAIAYLNKQGNFFRLTKTIGPCTVGLFQTAVYLPETIIRVADEKIKDGEEINGNEDVPEWYSSMVMHEMAHKNRYHYQILFLMRVLCAVYWFHPIIWILLVCLREDMELRCDYEAIKAMGEDNVSYIESMLTFARLRTDLEQSGKLEIGIPFLKKSGKLKKRVNGILLFPEHRKRLSIGMTAGAVGVIMIVAILMTRKENASEIAVKEIVPTGTESVQPSSNVNAAEEDYYFSEEEIEKAKEVVIKYWTAISNRDMETALECIHERGRELPGLPEVEEYNKNLDGEKKIAFVSCEYRADRGTKYAEKSLAKRLDPPVEAKNVICFWYTISITHTEKGVTYPASTSSLSIWLLREDEESDWYVVEIGG